MFILFILFLYISLYFMTTMIIFLIMVYSNNTFFEIWKFYFFIISVFLPPLPTTSTYLENIFVLWNFCSRKKWLKIVLLRKKVFLKKVLKKRYSLKKVFLEISQNSQENACVRVSFLNKVAGSGTGVSLSIL